jgi:hypothetical protein
VKTQFQILLSHSTCTATERCISADEPDLAGLAVRCLGQWRLAHLTPENAERLARLTGLDTMKEELTTLHMAAHVGSLQDGGGDGTMTDKSVAAATLPEHRPAFAALVVRCLLPRLKKRSGRYAPLRSGALAWIGRLDPTEIVPLIHSVIGPLEPRPETMMADSGGGKSINPVARTPWMDALVLTASGDPSAGSMWLRIARDANVRELVSGESGSKRPAGFLRAAGDLLKAMGEHTKVYLDPLLSLVLVLLEASSEICEAAAVAREAAAAEYRAGLRAGAGAGAGDGMDVDGAEEPDAEEEVAEEEEEEEEEDDDDGAAKKNKAVRGKLSASGSGGGSRTRDAREVRVLAVRFLGALFARHPGFDYSSYWPLVLSALSPMVGAVQLLNPVYPPFTPHSLKGAWFQPLNL